MTTRLIRAMLFEVDPPDPVTLLAAPALLVAVSLMAASADAAGGASRPGNHTS